MSNTFPISNSSQTPLVSEVVADVVSNRAEVTFGVMGNGNAFFVGRLISNGHKYVKARHEAGAMSMSQGYFMSSRRISVTTTTYGPGFTNTLTVLAEANLAGTPLVLVVGDGPTKPREFDIDQLRVAQALGIETYVVSRSNAQRVTNEAFDAAVRGLKPVIVAIPYDIAEELADPQEGYVSSPYAEIVEPSRRDVEQIAQILNDAKRPLLVAGRGAWLADAQWEFRNIGDKLGALFASSIMARNFSQSEWDLGIAGGFATLGAAEKMREADVVVFLGASMNLFQLRYGTLLRDANHVIQVNLEERPTSEEVTYHCRADIKSLLQNLDGLVKRSNFEDTWRFSSAEVANQTIHEPTELQNMASDGLVNPRALAWHLRKLLPKEHTLVQDGGHFLGWLAMYADSADPEALLHPGLTFHGIGFGFPTALGAAIARPDRLTVLTCGDGGGMMTLPDFETLIRESEKSLVIVFNDSAYGMEVHQYLDRGIDADPMKFENTDFAALANSLGARGIRVTDLEQLTVVEEFIHSTMGGTLVLDVQISPNVVAEYVQEKVLYEAAENNSQD